MFTCSEFSSFRKIFLTIKNVNNCKKLVIIQLMSKLEVFAFFRVNISFEFDIFSTVALKSLKFKLAQRYIIFLFFLKIPFKRTVFN